MKTIYNARHKYRLAKIAERSQMQQLMKKLSEHNYVEWHTTNPGTDVVNCLFYAHPLSIELLRSFPEVLIIDCTYKSNRYKLSLLQIVGVSSTDMTFVVAYAYLESENEENYTWALNKLKTLMDGYILPRVILTDRELALMNAIKVVFPNAANHLCRFHINRNVQGKCQKMFETKERWETFIMSWNVMVLSSTEEEYAKYLLDLEKNFKGYPLAIDYVKKSWLDKYKERFVAAWTDRQPHFGNTTTNRAESAHSKLKRHLGTSTSSFDKAWEAIHSMLELQHTKVRASFEKSLSTVQHKFKPAVFKELRNFISRNALDVVHSESNRADSIGPDAFACGCVIRRTHGLPCAHEIAEYKRDGRPIPLSCIHSNWRKLELVPACDDRKSTLSYNVELEQFQKRFDEADDSTKVHLLRKIKELANPSTSFLLEPEVKKNPRGRIANKKKNKRKKKLDTSTTRDPSMFEHALLALEDSQLALEDSQPPKKKKKQKERVYRTRTLAPISFVDLFPSPLRPFISNVEDMDADGNCGFRCVASLLGILEDDWVQVRKDLIKEFETHQMDYCQMYGDERFVEMIDALEYFAMGPCGKDNWMTMPNMGYVIASCYNVVLMLISVEQCLTFLPLRTVAPPVCNRTIVGIGFVNGNHFVKVFMSDSSPMPPIASNWYRHRHACARGWEVPYTAKIQHFRDIIGADVAIEEALITISDVSN